MNRLHARTALVVGGATGIGREVCRLFAQEGADVAVADLPGASGKHDLADELAGLGRTAFALDVDVRKPGEIVAAIDAAIARFGHLDILVNNAGASTPARPLAEGVEEDWRRILDINLLAAAFAMRHVLPHMTGRGFGRIINTASQLAHKPAAGSAIYGASKAALVALTVSAAQEVADRGVTVNAVCPGPTDTPMWRASDPDWNRWKISTLPIRRIAEPREIAWAYVFLASDEASYMIGQSVSPNGGDVMW